MAESTNRYCVSCGKPGPFRSAGALKCVRCDQKTAESRKQYHSNYHKARGEAVKSLIENHQKEYDRLLTLARARLEEESSPRRRRRAAG